MFFRGSRYEFIEEHETTVDGRTIRYKRIRFIRDPRPVRAHVVRPGDRLDRVAYLFFQDPEKFWRICDANRAMWPDDLVSDPGRRIAIPSAEG